MKHTNKIGALLFAVVIATAAPSAMAATEIGGYPCYGTVSIYVDGQPTNPCDTANDTVVRQAWRDASITGWSGPSAPQNNDELKAKVATLESQNASLASQVQALTQKVNQLANQQPVSSAPVQQVTQIVSGDYDARISAIEKEQKIVSGYMYILEQRIGENYARMMDLFAPVYKLLKLK